jgi:hypothetical protein
MLPDMSGAMAMWSKAVTWQSVTASITDFEPVEALTSTRIQATVQPADMERIKAEVVDFSLIYRTIHTTAQIRLRDYILDSDGVRFKLISVGDYGSYRTGLMEQVK